MSYRQPHLAQGLGEEMELLGGRRRREVGELVLPQPCTKPLFPRAPTACPTAVPSRPPFSVFVRTTEPCSSCPPHLRCLLPSLCSPGPASEPSLTTRAPRDSEEGRAWPQGPDH